MDVNLSLTNALKTVTTSKDGDNQLPSSIGNESLPCRGKDEEGNMFVAIRIMILIASAYAGSAVAEMQFRPLPNSALSSQP